MSVWLSLRGTTEEWTSSDWWTTQPTIMDGFACAPDARPRIVVGDRIVWYAVGYKRIFGTAIVTEPPVREIKEEWQAGRWPWWVATRTTLIIPDFDKAPKYRDAVPDLHIRPVSYLGLREDQYLAAENALRAAGARPPEQTRTKQSSAARGPSPTPSRSSASLALARPQRQAPPPLHNSFWESAFTAAVTFSRTDPAFRKLVTDLRDVSGIYSLELGSHVLRVGQSQSGLGQRLWHHLGAASEGAISRKTEARNHYEFHRALLGRRLTIRWRAYPEGELNAAERAAIRDAPGGVLWVQLKEDWKAVQHDPSQHGRLSKKMAATLASWDISTQL